MTTVTPDSSCSRIDADAPPSVIADVAARFDIAAVLDRAIRTGSKVDVDLSAVTFPYSGAARSIIDAVDASKAIGQQMQVVGANRVACRIFTALGAQHLPRELRVCRAGVREKGPGQSVSSASLLAHAMIVGVQ